MRWKNGEVAEPDPDSEDAPATRSQKKGQKANQARGSLQLRAVRPKVLTKRETMQRLGTPTLQNQKSGMAARIGKRLTGGIPVMSEPVSWKGCLRRNFAGVDLFRFQTQCVCKPCRTFMKALLIASCAN